MYSQDFQITFRTLIWGLGAMPPGKFCQNQCNLGVRVTPRFHHGGGVVMLENTVTIRFFNYRQGAARRPTMQTWANPKCMTFLKLITHKTQTSIICIRFDLQNKVLPTIV